MSMTLGTYKRQLDANIRCICQIDTKQDALPDLHWFLTRYKKKMLNRLNYLLSTLKAIDNQTLKEGTQALWLAFISLRYMAQGGREVASDYKTWHSTIIQFVALGLIYRHKVDERDESNRYMADSRRRGRKTGQKPISYYGVAAYTAQRLLEADRKAGQLRRSKVSTAKISKADVIQIWGQETADMIYQDSRSETDLQREIGQVLVSMAKELILKKGYTTKNELLQETTCHMKSCHPGQSKLAWTIQRLYQSRGRRLLHDAGIAYKVPTKKEMEQYSLPTKQWIIRNL